MRLKFRARRLARRVGLLGVYEPRHASPLDGDATQEFQVQVHIVAADSPSRRHPYAKEVA